MDRMQVIDAPPLTLEPLTVAHAAAMYEVLADPQIYRHLDDAPPASVEELRARYERLATRRSPDGAQRWLNWVVRVPESPPMGYVQATVVAGDRAWVGYALGSRHWGRGHARTAMQAMIEHLTQRYGVTRYLATVEAANERSIRLLGRLGFLPASAAEAAGHALSASERLHVR